MGRGASQEAVISLSRTVLGLLCAIMVRGCKRASSRSLTRMKGMILLEKRLLKAEMSYYKTAMRDIEMNLP